MGHIIVDGFSSLELADVLGLSHHGPEVSISGIASYDKRAPSLLSYFAGEALVDCSNYVVISKIRGGSLPSVLLSSNPRLDFCRALNLLFEKRVFRFDYHGFIHDSAVIHPTAYIADGAVIGARTVVGPSSVINSCVQIGDDCVIKPNCVIGFDGFGFERESNGKPVKMIHLGGVRIGNKVEIGALTTVCRGSIDDTVINDNTKIDDHVHVAHNVVIGENCLITACSEISGGVKIGNSVWLGPNCSIIQKAVISDGAFVGIAANVLSSVTANQTVVGNPAKPLKRDFDK